MIPTSCVPSLETPIPFLPKWIKCHILDITNDNKMNSQLLGKLEGNEISLLLLCEWI